MFSLSISSPHASRSSVRAASVPDQELRSRVSLKATAGRGGRREREGGMGKGSSGLCVSESSKHSTPFSAGEGVVGEEGADPPPDRRAMLLTRLMRASTATASGYPSCVGVASDLSTASILGVEQCQYSSSSPTHTQAPHAHMRGFVETDGGRWYTGTATLRTV